MTNTWRQAGASPTSSSSAAPSPSPGRCCGAAHPSPSPPSPPSLPLPPPPPPLPLPDSAALTSCRAAGAGARGPRQAAARTRAVATSMRAVWPPALKMLSAQKATRYHRMPPCAVKGAATSTPAAAATSATTTTCLYAHSRGSADSSHGVMSTPPCRRPWRLLPLPLRFCCCRCCGRRFCAAAAPADLLPLLPLPGGRQPRHSDRRDGGRLRAPSRWPQLGLAPPLRAPLSCRYFHERWLFGQRLPAGRGGARRRVGRPSQGSHAAQGPPHFHAAQQRRAAARRRRATGRARARRPALPRARAGAAALRAPPAPHLAAFGRAAGNRA